MRISLAFGATAFGLVAMLAGEALSGQPVAFRGDWTGRSEATNLPTTWSETAVWSGNRRLPGPGSSIPIVVNGRVYLTCYTGYAESIEEPGEMAGLVRYVLCPDRTSGKILWQKSFKARMRVRIPREQQHAARLRVEHADQRQPVPLYLLRRLRSLLP